MKKLEEQSEVELKALVYDNLTTINRSQANIEVLNQELARRGNKPEKVVVETTSEEAEVKEEEGTKDDKDSSPK